MTDPVPTIGTVATTDTFGRLRRPKRKQLTHVRIGNRPLCGLHKPARRWAEQPTQLKPNCARCHEIANRRQDPQVLQLWQPT
jgi:hypothetical protein